MYHTDKLMNNKNTCLRLKKKVFLTTRVSNVWFECTCTGKLPSLFLFTKDTKYFCFLAGKMTVKMSNDLGSNYTIYANSPWSSRKGANLQVSYRSSWIKASFDLTSKSNSNSQCLNALPCIFHQESLTKFTETMRNRSILWEGEKGQLVLGGLQWFGKFGK